MQIVKPKISAYDAADDALKALLDKLGDTLLETGNWRVRKKRFLDIIDGLQLAFEMDPVAFEEELKELGLDMPPEADEDQPEGDRPEGEATAAPEAEPAPEAAPEAGEKAAADEAPDDQVEDEALEDEDDDEELEEDMGFPEVLPMYVGALLEKLNEDRITCVEQAAFYLLSIHREHQEAVENWLKSDHRNTKAFRKLLRADRRYAGILDMMEEYFGEGPLADLDKED